VVPDSVVGDLRPRPLDRVFGIEPCQRARLSIAIPKLDAQHPTYERTTHHLPLDHPARKVEPDHRVGARPQKLAHHSVVAVHHPGRPARSPVYVLGEGRPFHPAGTVMEGVELDHRQPKLRRKGARERGLARTRRADHQHSLHLYCDRGHVPPTPRERALPNRAVRKEGVEPSRELPHRNQNPARLPVPPLSLILCLSPVETDELGGLAEGYYLTQVEVRKSGQIGAVGCNSTAWCPMMRAMRVGKRAVGLAAAGFCTLAGCLLQSQPAVPSKANAASNQWDCPLSEEAARLYQLKQFE
jgi:hypothetical protein